MAAKKKAKKAAAKAKKITRKPASKAKAPSKKKAATRKAKKSAAAPKKARAAQTTRPRAKAAPTSKPSAATVANEGRIVWHELTTTDLPAAVKFYSDLFGWTASDMPLGESGRYTIFTLNGEQVGGAMTPMPGDSSPPHWVPYCTTLDVDAALERARQAGATIYVPGTEIPNVGRFGVFQDPQGAVLYPFTPNQEAPVTSGPPPNHTFCWDECLTTDPEASVEFYRRVFPWSTQAMDMPGGKYFVLLRAGQQMSGGITGLPMEGVPPHWMSHVAVEDIEATLAKLESLGGQVISGPMSIGMGRTAVVKDPTGATFSIFQGK